MALITTIGSLASAANALFKLADYSRPLLGRADAQSMRDKAVTELRGRLEGIALQLERANTLSRLVSEWLFLESEFDSFEASLSDDDVRRLDRDLRRLIDMSVRDQFSGAFFRTQFDVLPGVEYAMASFRDSMKILDVMLRSIKQGDFPAWRERWPLLGQQLRQCRLDAMKVHDCADERLSEIIAEIRDASRPS